MTYYSYTQIVSISSIKVSIYMELTQWSKNLANLAKFCEPSLIQLPRKQSRRHSRPNTKFGYYNYIQCAVTTGLVGALPLSRLLSQSTQCTLGAPNAAMIGTVDLFDEELNSLANHNLTLKYILCCTVCIG